MRRVSPIRWPGCACTTSTGAEEARRNESILARLATYSQRHARQGATGTIDDSPRGAWGYPRHRKALSLFEGTATESSAPSCTLRAELQWRAAGKSIGGALAISSRFRSASRSADPMPPASWRVRSVRPTALGAGTAKIKTAGLPECACSAGWLGRLAIPVWIGPCARGTIASTDHVRRARPTGTLVGGTRGAQLRVRGHALA